MFPAEIWALVLDTLPLQKWIRVRHLFGCYSDRIQPALATTALLRAIQADASTEVLTFLRHATQHSMDAGISTGIRRGNVSALQLLSEPCAICGTQGYDRQLYCEKLEFLLTHFTFSEQSIPALHWVVRTWQVKESDLSQHSLMRVLLWDMEEVFQFVFQEIPCSRDSIEELVRRVLSVAGDKVAVQRSIWLLQSCAGRPPQHSK